MDKLAQLLNIINVFSIDAHWDYRLTKFAADSASLLAKSEDFDIKDEELFNQFESFMSAYRELVDTLEVDVHNFNPDSLEQAGQLIDTLKRRYDRLISNKYLNVTEDEGYEEDFDPGDFTTFITQVAADAEAKLKAIAGEDIDISEMRAAQYAQEFNDNKNIDRGDQNITWTGDKVRQNLEARKRWFQNLMMLKKININDPRVQHYIATRKKQYADIMADPVRKAAYYENARKRTKKRYSKIQQEYVNKRKHLKTLIVDAKRKGDFAEVTRLTKMLEEIQHVELSKEKSTAQRIKKTKSEGGLEGLNIKLQQRIATQKMEIKKSVAERMRQSKNTIFKSYLDQLEKARLANDSTAVVNATQQLQKAMGTYAEEQPEVAAFVTNSQAFRMFRERIKDIIERRWVTEEGILPEVVPHVQNIISDGRELVSQYDGVQFFNPLVNSVKDIITNLEGKI